MKYRNGLFVAEGTSDLPLADLVEALFLECGALVRLRKPDFSLLPGVKRDVASRVKAGIRLEGVDPLSVVVVHRDADNAGYDARRSEIHSAIADVADIDIVPVVPIRMTEAWLLLDEEQIRSVAGNPKGSVQLNLPRRHEVEALADPKGKLQQTLLAAAEVTGRRREAAAKRFNHHRRQLLERLDRTGAVCQLSSWKSLVDEIQAIAARWEALDSAVPDAVHHHAVNNSGD